MRCAGQLTVGEGGADPSDVSGSLLMDWRVTLGKLVSLCEPQFSPEEHDGVGERWPSPPQPRLQRRQHSWARLGGGAWITQCTSARQHVISRPSTGSKQGQRRIRGDVLTFPESTL